MEYLKKYVRKYIRLFLAAIFFLSVEAACDLLQPAVMSRIVDVGIRRSDLHYVLGAGGLMLLITGVGACGAVVRNNISSRVSQRFGAELRKDLFCRIQNLSYDAAGWFETGSLVTRLTNDVTQTQNFVNGMMRIFVKAPLTCVGSIILSVALSPRLSLVMAAVIPVVFCVIYLSNHIGYPFFRRAQQALDRLNSVIRETLAGVRVTRAFNRSDYEERRFSFFNETLAGAQISAMKVTSVFSPVTMMTVNLGIAAVLWMGGVNVDAGGVQVGRVIALINYMTIMANSLMMISTVFTMFVRARASAERIGEVMNANDRMPRAPRPVTRRPDGRVEFKNVSFAYPGGSGRPALSGVSFSCKTGSTLGIIGSTGSGKSSLVGLIPRFYDVTGGAVLVDGRDVRAYEEHALRAAIALVPQKNTLFTGSILENIRWGCDGADRARVERAARTAQIHDFIVSLPEGYDTLLGQGGVNLSGGQKQRIAIARALVREAGILLLDDCTSAVDLATEGRIRAGLREHSAGLCCLVVAQRITSVMDADQILVLEGGRVAGLGSHRELLDSCGIYRDIYASQFGTEAM